MLNRIVDQIIKNSNYTAADKVILLYGLTSLLKLAAFIITVLLFGLFVGLVIEVLLFIITFSLLRTYTGGFHLDNEIYCYLFSCSISFFALLLIKYIDYNMTIFVIVIVLLNSVPIVVLFSPIEAQNKSLNEKEKIIYRRKARVYLFWIVGFIFLFIFLSLYRQAVTVAMGLQLVSFMMMFNVLNKYKRKCK